eukprot:jgi/Mesvir1/5830/Mv00625-RA.1
MDNVRYQNCLRVMRERARDIPADGQGSPAVSRSEWQELKVHIASCNNFPTAAGLASSAAGFACLVYALAQLMGVEEAYPGELTAFARLGSGSACRSLYGGFVRWSMGSRPDGSDSVADQIAPETHWPELRVVVAVVSDKAKETGSTSGMEQSVKTSSLLAHRAQVVVPQRILAMEAAIMARDFDAFGRITMADSNQLHAVCLDTQPPIFYMNDVSKRIVGIIERLNQHEGKIVAAYTFDAGPNAVIYCLDDTRDKVLHRLLYFFPPALGTPLASFITGEEALSRMGLSTAEDLAGLQPPPEVQQSTRPSHALRESGLLQSIICTRAGSGASVVPAPTPPLLDAATGFPPK